MYLTVLTLILGQSLAFPNWWVLAYLAVLIVVFDLFVRRYEEPTLRRAHGDEYIVSAAAVPRWRPRLTPWSPPDRRDRSEDA